MTENIVLIACGTFNPPTPMHFRMFEIARDYFRVTNKGNVVGGIISPVHDSYKKSNVAIVNAKHRCKMINLSLSSDWIRISDWEINQDKWTRTAEVLQYHQNHLNSILGDKSKHWLENRPDWAPLRIDHLRGQQVRVKLLCGSDLLESFANRNLWIDTELETILGEHGVVVIVRNGTNPQKFVFESDLMFENQNNITIIDNWVPNEISSTLARLHFQRGLSLKYLLNDDVIVYINQRKLYGSKANREYVPKPDKFLNIPRKVIINIKDETSNELDMDVTDSSPSKSVKPRRSARTSSTKKRKRCLRDQKTKKRSRFDSKQVEDYSSNDSDTN